MSDEYNWLSNNAMAKGMSDYADMAKRSTDFKPLSENGFDWGSFSKNLGNMGDLLSGIGGLGQAWLGFKNYGLAKDQLAFQKESFQNQYGMQVQDYNRKLADQYAARYQGADATQYGGLSYADHMARYGANNPYTATTPSNPASTAPVGTNPIEQLRRYG